MPATTFPLKLLPGGVENEALIRAYQRMIKQTDELPPLKRRLTRSYIIDIALLWLIANHKALLTVNTVKRLRDLYHQEMTDAPADDTTTINPIKETFDGLAVVAEHIVDLGVNFPKFITKKPRNEYPYNIRFLIYAALLLYAEHIRARHPNLKPDQQKAR